MSFYAISFSLLAGTVVGIVYGLFFVETRKRAFSSCDNAHNTRPATIYLRALSSAFIRMIAIITLGYYLLYFPAINSILLITSFLGSFWLTVLIITKKGLSHGRDKYSGR